MPASDANEQVKEVLRQLIKHRFWIAIGFACLFAVIAYFMGSGPVQAKAKAEITKIEGAEKGVKAYQVPSKPTDAYKPIIVEKTEIVGKDVNKAWKKLYDRQAPLLTWPEPVKNRIPKWGRKWPKDIDGSQVQIAIIDYITAYPEYVDMVYKSFEPFDYESGKGVVAAPPKEQLLRPSQFSKETSKLPTLGKVWWAQERLWIQRTVLDVVRQVNNSAKDWDSAIIKEIIALQVGNAGAQDQQSLAKGEQLNQAADIMSPEQEAAAAASKSDSGTPGASAGGMSGRMRENMMMGGGSGASVGDESIYYITPPNDKGQYKILPVSLTVLIDQDHVQDLLVELENSPMAIQVKDFELERPSALVAKPEKGSQPAGMMGGMMGMMDRMGGMGGGMMAGMMGRRGYGGRAARMEGMMGDMMRGGRGMNSFAGGGTASAARIGRRSTSVARTWKRNASRPWRRSRSGRAPRSSTRTSTSFR